MRANSINSTFRSGSHFMNLRKKHPDPDSIDRNYKLKNLVGVSSFRMNIWNIRVTFVYRFIVCKYLIAFFSRDSSASLLRHYHKIMLVDMPLRLSQDPLWFVASSGTWINYEDRDVRTFPAVSCVSIHCYIIENDIRAVCFFLIIAWLLNATHALLATRAENLINGWCTSCWFTKLYDEY